MSIANFVLAGVGLTLGFAALVVAVRALRVTGEQTAMMRLEHDEFMRQMRARVRLDVTLVANFDLDDDGVIVHDARRIHPRIEVGITNTGDKAAGKTLINVLIPQTLADFRWARQGGESVTGAGPSVTTAEHLDVDGVDAGPAQYLIHVFEGVELDWAHVLYAQFALELSEDQVEIPVVVRVETADLVEDQRPKVVETLTIRARRAQIS